MAKCIDIEYRSIDASITSSSGCKKALAYNLAAGDEKLASGNNHRIESGIEGEALGSPSKYRHWVCSWEQPVYLHWISNDVRYVWGGHKLNFRSSCLR